MKCSCGGLIKESKAIQQTWVAGLKDFPGDIEDGIRTMHAGGSGLVIDCYKCSDCGKSWKIGG